MSPTQGLEPTQTRRPWRATLRTALAVGIPAILLLPTVIQVLVDELGPNLPDRYTSWLIAAGAIVTAVAAAITRIMALPQVELLLRRLPGAAFAAQPQPKPKPLDRGEDGYVRLLGTPARGASRDRSQPGKSRIRARRTATGDPRRT